MGNLNRRHFLAAGLFGSLSACSGLPRGAPLEREVLRGAADPLADFVVYPVTRAFLPIYAEWPDITPQRSWIARQTGPTSRAISPGDTLDIVVWDADPNSLLTAPTQQVTTIENVSVAPNGTVFIPYIGEVSVGGLTQELARERIQEALEAIVSSAQVQLVQLSGRMNSVDIVGGVSSPGRVALLDRNTSILNAIAEGGGVAGVENPQVRLIRGDASYVIALDRLVESPALDTTLRGGDKIVVEEDPRHFITLGATGNETMIAFGQEQISALEALALAGGIDDRRGDPGGILILRNYPASALSAGPGGPGQPRVVFTVDLTSADGLFSAKDFQVEPGDVLVATESPVSAAETILSLFGSSLTTATRVREAV